MGVRQQSEAETSLEQYFYNTFCMVKPLTDDEKSVAK
jgi:hypothetical protein